MQGVSIIICCYNSASRISETLKHLSLQEIPPEFKWEIVLVDNASTDNTKEVAEKLWQALGRTDVTLKITDQPIQGLSFARAKGVEVSRYDKIIFCDDDNWLHNNYLLEASRILNSNAQIGALGGTGIAVADVPLPFWFEQYKGCFACYPQGEQEGELAGIFSFLYGAGLVVRRDVLVKLESKKFKPILPDRIGLRLTSGGDTELCYAIRLIGYKLWFSDKLKFYHCLPSSRLTEQYLFKLISSMSYCSGILIPYTYVLLEKKVTRLTWIKDLTYQIIFFTRSLLFSFLEKNSKLEKKLNVAFSFNRMRSILRQAGTYRWRYSQIMKLRK